MEPSTVPTRQEALPLAATAKDPRAAKILARSLFKELTQNGLTQEQVLAVSSELIALVTEHLKETSDLAKSDS
jgi:hypothetical protein